MAVEAIIVSLIVAAFIGFKLMKRQSQLLMRQFTMMGNPSTDQLKTLALLLAGLLLAIPGYITDVFALLLFLKPVRYLIQGQLLHWASRKFSSHGGFHVFRGGHYSPFSRPPDEPKHYEGRQKKLDDVIDVEAFEN